MPKYSLLDPKTPLFNDYFALFSHVFHGSKGLYLYLYRVCLCFLTCVKHHFELHLAPFHLAFSTKTHSILHQNALHLAAYCTAFSTKTHCILQQIAPKWVSATVCLNKYSLFRIHKLPPFCTITNRRENRFFAARLAVDGQKGHSEC